jgi:uncharacterized protein
MTVEYNPVGVACNIACGYCYQDPMREAGNINVPRDWPRVRDQLDRLGEFAVFGGEALLAPLAHLEEVFAYGFARHGQNGIQTNGTLITDAHLDLFERYQVHVGISIDGPPELNHVRCAPELTARTIRAIETLCDRGLFPSIITTIHRGNANLPRLTAFFDWLADHGVRHLNLHELEVECGREHLALSEEENIRVYLALYEWSKTTMLRVLPFADIQTLLTTESPSVMCTWNACDPLTTPAVHGLNANGDLSNCGRTNKDGVNWLKGDRPGAERSRVLYHTPQAYGGCQGCAYFAFCKGQCPGTAIDGDWRNRTANCRLWYALFERIERDLDPATLLTPEVRRRLEARLVADAVHGDSPHGDSPHGDAHGDHTDYGRRCSEAPRIPVTFLGSFPYGATPVSSS